MVQDFTRLKVGTETDDGIIDGCPAPGCGLPGLRELVRTGETEGELRFTHSQSATQDGKVDWVGHAFKVTLSLPTRDEGYAESVEVQQRSMNWS
jgi:hypothetical protein